MALDAEANLAAAVVETATAVKGKEEDPTIEKQ